MGHMNIDYDYEVEVIRKEASLRGGFVFKAHQERARRLGYWIHKCVPVGFGRLVMMELFGFKKMPEHMTDCLEGPVSAVLELYFDEYGDPTERGRAVLSAAYHKVQEALGQIPLPL